MTSLYLALAIKAEIAATTALKFSDSFTKPLPTISTVVGYAIAFYFLSLNRSSSLTERRAGNGTPAAGGRERADADARTDDDITPPWHDRATVQQDAAGAPLCGKFSTGENPVNEGKGEENQKTKSFAARHVGAQRP